MLHSEMSKGETLEIGSGLQVMLVRKHADGSATLTLMAKPGASLVLAYGDEQARLLVAEKDGARARLSIEAPRRVTIRKQA